MELGLLKVEKRIPMDNYRTISAAIGALVHRVAHADKKKRRVLSYMCAYV